MGTPSAEATVASAASCDRGRTTPAGAPPGGGVEVRQASTANVANAAGASKEVTSTRIVPSSRSGESANDNLPAPGLCLRRVASRLDCPCLPPAVWARGPQSYAAALQT